MEGFAIEYRDRSSKRRAGMARAWRARRTARATLRALDLELAGYTSPADLDELEAIVERVERVDNVTLADYRHIINRRRGYPHTARRTLLGVPAEAVYMLTLAR